MYGISPRRVHNNFIWSARKIYYLPTYISIFYYTPLQLRVYSESVIFSTSTIIYAVCNIIYLHTKTIITQHNKIYSRK